MSLAMLSATLAADAFTGSAQGGHTGPSSVETNLARRSWIRTSSSPALLRTTTHRTLRLARRPPARLPAITQGLSGSWGMVATVMPGKHFSEGVDSGSYAGVGKAASEQERLEGYARSDIVRQPAARPPHCRRGRRWNDLVYCIYCRNVRGRSGKNGRQPGRI